MLLTSVYDNFAICSFCLFCISAEGILKDYLRELPSPLITKELYEAVLETMIKAPLKTIGNGDENAPSDAEQTVALLNCLPEVEKVSS